MRSERIRIANRYESEGKEQQQQILGQLVKELDEISSDGYKQAAIIRGRADATVPKNMRMHMVRIPTFLIQSEP